jgi:predicted phosphohydrolase
MKTTRIQYASDLHIEFPANKQFLKQNPLLAVGDVLVLAGDIVPFHVMDKHRDFFSFLSDNFAATYWLPGNHEYYYFDVAEKSGVLHEKIRDNVFLVNNTSAVHGDVKLIFSTLWSKISPGYQWDIERGMNDFRVIKYKGKRFSAESYNALFTENLAFIEAELEAETDKKLAVFTHHCPTMMHYPPLYKGSVLNEAFAVELFDLIEPSNIATWVYGHHHSNIPEFEIGNTLMCTNQLGYVQLGENKGFEPGKCLEI